MTTQIEITSLAHGGDGIGRVDGQVWFVPYGLPGDILRVVEVRRARGVVWGKIESIDTASPHRSQPPCPVFGTCGGCTWLHFAYPAQAEWKVRIVSETLARVGGIQAEVGWLEDSALRTGYRTRAEFQGDRMKRGFYALGSHDIVDVPHCALCHPKLNAVLDTLRTGLISGPVEVTVDPEGEGILCWTNKPNTRLERAFPGAQSFKSREDRAQFMFDGVPVVNGCFTQSSLTLNRMLCNHVRELLGGSKDVLDLYCGSGNFSLMLEANVLGIDHNRASIQAAQHCQRGEYVAGSEPDFVRAIENRGSDAIILDPPRTGAKGIMSALAVARAERIVYVSCDVATLARDLKVLVAAGWTVNRLTAIDMFPNTAHVEIVALLTR